MSVRTTPDHPVMGWPPDDPSDALTSYTRRHLAVVLAALARVTGDPTLAFDLASEAVAAGHRAARADTPGGRSIDELTCVLEAAERVVREAIERGRVPSGERSRRPDARPTTLTPEALAGIAALGRRPLDDHPLAQQLADVLARDVTPAAVRHVTCSALVHRRHAPDARRAGDRSP